MILVELAGKEIRTSTCTEQACVCVCDVCVCVMCVCLCDVCCMHATSVSKPQVHECVGVLVVLATGYA